MSALGDLIIEHGPFTAGQPLPVELLLTTLGSAERLNALRDELVELRAGRDLLCAYCDGRIWWNPDEPTGQAAGWRHDDQVAFYESGGGHHATPRGEVR